MIILATNILSELMKLSPNSNVVAWLDEQNVSDLFITTITVAEISYGISALPEGKRKLFLERANENDFSNSGLSLVNPFSLIV